MTYTDAELLAALRAFADEHGTIPSSPAVNEDDDMASASTYANRFGSWSGGARRRGPADVRRER